MTKQFEKGKPVWYVNKRTKKVYVGAYVKPVYNYGKLLHHIIYTNYANSFIVKPNCLFNTKAEARYALQHYLNNRISKLNLQLDRLTVIKEKGLQECVYPTFAEEKAYKRLYARYLDWSGERGLDNER